MLCFSNRLVILADRFCHLSAVSLLFQRMRQNASRHSPPSSLKAFLQCRRGRMEGSSFILCSFSTCFWLLLSFVMITFCHPWKLSVSVSSFMHSWITGAACVCVRLPSAYTGWVVTSVCKLMHISLL